MQLDAKTQLFFGYKVDSKMRELMSMASPGDKRYIDDEQFLRILQRGEEKWIGKVVDGPIPPTQVEDIQRNVISIMNRVAPGGRHSPSTMRIFTVDPTPLEVKEEPPASMGY